MPTTAQIENADPLTASQATRLISLLKASARYNAAPWAYGGLDARVFAKVSRRFTITGATNATPIVVTAAGHGFLADDPVAVEGVLGNTAADGDWLAANVTDDTLGLKGSVGNAAYTSGGAITDYRSKLLAAITEALDLLKDSTLAIKGGTKGIDLSKERDREKLCEEAFDALYTSAEQPAFSGLAMGVGSFHLTNIPTW